MTKSISNHNKVVILLLACLSCSTEPCFDIPKIDRFTEYTKDWFVDENIGNTTFIDSNGISQTLIKQDSYYYSHSFIEDDCGKTYDHFNHSIQLITSLSGLHFIIDVGGATFDSTGFYLRLGITNLDKGYKSMEYDFYTKKTRDSNAIVKFLPELSMTSREFEDVLEIDFKKTFSPTDAKVVYYAKGYGIIKFIQQNGNVYEVNSI
ncbi:hypothetical protein [Flagellimonas sp.]|uniref:hypothetical protein n=1 Tax=Flagellimonas sp. TaxID=2058762 RepID=UPI003B510F41